MERRPDGIIISDSRERLSVFVARNILFSCGVCFDFLGNGSASKSNSKQTLQQQHVVVCRAFLQIWKQVFMLSSAKCRNAVSLDDKSSTGFAAMCRLWCTVHKILNHSNCTAAWKKSTHTPGLILDSVNKQKQKRSRLMKAVALPVVQWHLQLCL